MTLGMTPIAYALIGLFVMVVVGIFVWRRARHLEERDEFWYEVCKDFVGPIFVAILGFWVATQFEEQHVTSSKEAALREMMTTRNGPDVAFFTAVGERLTVHLQRYEKLRLKEIQGKPEDLEKAKLFDERAIYFF